MEAETKIELRSVRELEHLDRSLDIYTRSRTSEIHPDIIRKRLYPPVVVTDKRIVWGFGIIRSARHMGEELLLCNKTGEEGMFEALKLSLELENRPRKYSWFEKVRIVKLSSGKNQLDEIGNLVEGKDDPEWYKRVLLFESLPETLQHLVEEEKLDLKTANDVKGLPPGVFDTIAEGKITFSQRRIILRLLKEIAKRDELGDKAVLETLKSAMKHKDPVSYVERLRYPELTGMRERFDSLYKKYLSGSKIRLYPPPYFEGSDFTLQFNFSGKRNFEKKIEYLEKLKGVIDEFLELLR